jgi:3D (Asp-Asp-Asp) domain-containing protein
VQTVREKLETRDEALAADFRVQLTTQIAPGREQVVQWPKAGTATNTYKVVYVGSKPLRKTFVSREVEVPAQDKILAVGVDGRFMPHAVPYHKRYARAYQLHRQMSARGGSPRDRVAVTSSSSLRPVKTFIAHTSGYAAGPAGGSLGNYTATGMRCVRGAVATDPRVIPLGTKMYIDGYGYAFACDTGGAIKGNRIDLAFNTVGECFQHGRRKNRVWILGP